MSVDEQYQSMAAKLHGARVPRREPGASALDAWRAGELFVVRGTVKSNGITYQAGDEINLSSVNSDTVQSMAERGQIVPKSTWLAGQRYSLMADIWNDGIEPLWAKLGRARDERARATALLAAARAELENAERRARESKEAAADTERELVELFGSDGTRAAFG